MVTLQNDSNTIQLSKYQREDLATTANQAGRPWPEVFADALKKYRSVEKADDTKKTRFGTGQGVFTMTDDFDVPLEEFREYME